MLSLVSRRVATRSFSTAPQMVLNFTTPYATIFSDKVVDRVVLPGAAGEYGVTVGHSPLISELKPGVVAVQHVGGETEKFFVPGGFALTNKDSVTNVSVTEAVPLENIDDSAVRALYADATKALASAAEGSAAKATAQIEIDTLTTLARAINLTL